jgi:hypothetical protein
VAIEEEEDCLFVALGVQHEQRVRHIVLSSVACVAVPYVSTLFHKRQDFRKLLKLMFMVPCIVNVFAVHGTVHR